MNWNVMRHGGRFRGSGSKWRCVADGDEATCREVYTNHVALLRQGTVRLYRGDELMESTSAPNLRSIW